MSLSKADLEEIKRFVAGKLSEIDDAIYGTSSTLKLTCLIRDPRFRDGYLIVTNDSLQELSKVIERANLKGADGEEPPPPPVISRSCVYKCENHGNWTSDDNDYPDLCPKCHHPGLVVAIARGPL